MTAEPASCDSSISSVMEIGPHAATPLDMICGRTVAQIGPSIGLFGRFKSPTVENFSKSPIVSSLFAEMLKEQALAAEGSKHMIRCLMEQCLIHVFRRLCSDGNCQLSWLTALDDPALSRVLTEIMEEPTGVYSVESLAEIAAMSRAVFS